MSNIAFGTVTGHSITSGTSNTFNATIGASDTGFFVAEGQTHSGSANIPTGVTLNGIALALEASADQVDGSVHMSTSLWQLAILPAPGTYPVVVTYANSVSAAGAVAVPVDNFGSLGTAVSAGAASNVNPAVTATGAGSTDQYLGIAMNSASTQTDAGTGQAALEALSALNTNYSLSVSAIPGSDAGAFSWTGGSTHSFTAWSALAVPLLAAAASSSNHGPYRGFGPNLRRYQR